MTVEEYIKAIKTASSSDEILTLWSQVAGESTMTMDDIIIVHRNCGQIVTNAALEMRARTTGIDDKSRLIMNKA